MARNRISRYWIAVVFCAVSPAYLAAQVPSLSGATSWAYWLSTINVSRVARSSFDLVIVDYSSDGSQAHAFTPAEIARMQRKPDGSRRLVIAYLSIGEAEDYRYYWQPAWQQNRPGWLDRENPSWPGNLKVHYWDPAWQSIIFGSPSSYLDRIVSAGFDGAMLDIVDAYEYFVDGRPQAPVEMKSFVERISRYAKARHPGFLIVPQNGETLLDDSVYRDAIDGVVKEDLYYGMRRDGVRNSREATEYSRSFLEMATAAGKPVFTVDYVHRKAQVADVFARSRRDGFVPYAARRALDSLTVNRGWDP